MSTILLAGWSASDAMRLGTLVTDPHIQHWLSFLGITYFAMYVNLHALLFFVVYTLSMSLQCLWPPFQALQSKEKAKENTSYNLPSSFTLLLSSQLCFHFIFCPRVSVREPWLISLS